MLEHTNVETLSKSQMKEKIKSRHIESPKRQNIMDAQVAEVFLDTVLLPKLKTGSISSSGELRREYEVFCQENAIQEFLLTSVSFIVFKRRLAYFAQSKITPGPLDSESSNLVAMENLEDLLDTFYQNGQD